MRMLLRTRCELRAVLIEYQHAAAEGFFGRLKNEFFHGRDCSGVGAEEFMARLDAWMEHYRSGGLRAFREDGRWVYDTIDGRRDRLGLAT